VTTTSSYQSANDRRVHFGLGEDKVVPRIEIRWPSGRRQTLEDIPVNQILKVTEE
jgi:enediyne biosynthesis protein E4